MLLSSANTCTQHNTNMVGYGVGALWVEGSAGWAVAKLRVGSLAVGLRAGPGLRCCSDKERAEMAEG